MWHILSFAAAVQPSPDRDAYRLWMKNLSVKHKLSFSYLGKAMWAVVREWQAAAAYNNNSLLRVTVFVEKSQCHFFLLQPHCNRYRNYIFFPSSDLHILVAVKSRYPCFSIPPSFLYTFLILLTLFSSWVCMKYFPPCVKQQTINQLINLILLTASELVLVINIDEILLLKDTWLHNTPTN